MIIIIVIMIIIIIMMMIIIITLASFDLVHFEDSLNSISYTNSCV